MAEERIKKRIIVINGAGGVGKDTMVDFAGKRYMVWNCSSIEPIKKAAKLLGWDIKQKDDRSRKFLSDLKMLSTEYNDCPFNYIVDYTQRFLESWGHGEILFVHIREPYNIKKFVDAVTIRFGVKPITLLIRRDAVTHEYGNIADDGVEDFQYDYYFDNSMSLEDAEVAFLRLLEEMA